MNTGLRIISAALVILDLLACMAIALHTRKSSHDTQDYFISGKKTGTALLLLTAWASFSGAGNFIGQAGRGALYGINAYWLWLGESLLGGIVMGAIIAPYLARFRYVSMPHYIADYLCGGNNYIRRIGGIAALMPNLVWPGAQIMGIAYVMELVFGINYRLAVIVCGIVLISHTASGGFNAVIYADALHGTIQILFAVFVIDPEGKLPPEKGVKYAKIATILAGVVGIFCGLYADYIYALGVYGYTICGGVLIPLFVIGLCA
jgi:Na+/proline symporter